MGSEDRSTQKDTSSSAGASSLSDLIERLEKATGPDRELDADIALQFDWTECPGDNWIGPQGEIAVPAYTSSIDAAMTLVSHDWRIYAIQEEYIVPRGNWFAGLDHRTAHHKYGSMIGKSFTPAIALCIAALRARSLPAI